MKNWFLAIFTTILVLPDFGLAAPSGFVYQGQIIKPSGQALEDLSVDFLIQIISPGSESCILYEETHTLNM